MINKVVRNVAIPALHFGNLKEKYLAEEFCDGTIRNLSNKVMLIGHGFEGLIDRVNY